MIDIFVRVPRRTGGLESPMMMILVATVVPRRTGGLETDPEPPKYDDDVPRRTGGLEMWQWQRPCHL